MGRHGFSYDLLNSDETRAIYQQMLDEDAAKVLAFRDRAPVTRARMGAVALTNAWFMQYGALNKFRDTTTALQYRREVAARVAVALYREASAGIATATE